MHIFCFIACYTATIIFEVLVSVRMDDFPLLFWIKVPSDFFKSVWLGDIGGQMGLFIGASILTILELFDYLYEVKYLF